MVEGPLGEGTLDLPRDFARARALTRAPLKFTVTSPYMLARSVLDLHYRDFESLTMALAHVLAQQVAGLTGDTLQVDEANIPGNPKDGPLAARAINAVLAGFTGRAAVHLCFGNYGGQTIQKGHWDAIIGFLNELRVDHLVLELAHRPPEDLAALRQVNSLLGFLADSSSVLPVSA